MDGLCNLKLLIGHNHKAEYGLQICELSSYDKLLREYYKEVTHMQHIHARELDLTFLLWGHDQTDHED